MIVYIHSLDNTLIDHEDNYLSLRIRKSDVKPSSYV